MIDHRFIAEELHAPGDGAAARIRRAIRSLVQVQSISSSSSVGADAVVAARRPARRGGGRPGRRRPRPRAGARGRGGQAFGRAPGVPGRVDGEPALGEDGRPYRTPPRGRARSPPSPRPPTERPKVRVGPSVAGQERGVDADTPSRGPGQDREGQPRRPEPADDADRARPRGPGRARRGCDVRFAQTRSLRGVASRGEVRPRRRGSARRRRSRARPVEEHGGEWEAEESDAHRRPA